MKYSLLLIFFISFKVSHGQSQFGHGEEIVFKNNEIMPSLFFLVEYDDYILQAPFFNITIIPKDYYNRRKVNFSITGVLTFGTMLVFLPFTHGKDSTDKSVNIPLMTFSILSGIFNSQHHYKILTHNNSVFSKQADLALILNSRTDWYVQDNNWVRYSLGLGLEYLIEHPFYLKNSIIDGYSFQVGVEQPFDFIKGKRLKKKLRVFFGFKLYSN